MVFTFEWFLEVAIRAIDMLTFILGFNKNNNNWPLHFVLIGHYTLAIIMVRIEAIFRRYCSKQLFLKISQILQGNTVRACNFIKKVLQHRCFPMKFAKFFRTPFFYRTPPMAASVCRKATKHKENNIKKKYSSRLKNMDSRKQ